MNRETLALLRDLSFLLLCLYMAIFVAIPGVVFYFAQMYLRKGRRALKLPLLKVQVLFLRVERLTLDMSNRIVGVPIAVRAFNARLRATALKLVGRT